MQILADFTGYSLIALERAALFGYQLSVNFNFSYVSSSFADFWRRWHIPLSSFLRDYLYIQLGGNRPNTAQTYANLLLTMALEELWHGAAWSYAIWGFVHGLASRRAVFDRQRLAYDALGSRSIYQKRVDFLFRYAGLAAL